MKAVTVIKFSLIRMCCFMVCLVMFNIYFAYNNKWNKGIRSFIGKIIRLAGE